MTETRDLLHGSIEDDQKIILETEALEHALSKKDRCGEEAAESLERIRQYAFDNSKS